MRLEVYITMAGEQIPINPIVLSWARRRAGYSLEELSSDFAELPRWEEEESLAFPTYPQLERLADKLKTPLAVFFFPEPPDLEPIEKSFRTLAPEQYALLPKRIQFLLKKAKAFQLNLAGIYGDGTASSKQMAKELSFPVDVNIQEMATKVRDYIGISIDEQMSWSGPDVALKRWRSLFEELGVYVFKDAFLENDYSGFCLEHKQYPLIYVNNSHSKTRQIFTLFHELAHLVFHTSGVDKIHDDFLDALEGEARAIEVICNRFASEFLVPRTSFTKEFAGLSASRESASQLAAKYCVSREVIYRIYLDRKLIGQAEYSAAARQWSSEVSKKQGSGGDYYNNQIAYLGRPYIGAAFREYHSNRIDKSQLADYLNIKPKNVNALEEKFLGRNS